MNILDLKRKAAGWMLRWGDSEGANADGNGDSGSSSDGMGAGMGSNAGESGDSNGTSGGGGGSDYSGYNPANTIGSPNFTRAERDAIGNLQGFNPNNPTQSLAEMEAAQNFHNFMNQYASAIPSMMGAPAAFTMAMNFASGKQSVGQSLASAAISAAAQSIGVSTSVLSSALSGNFGAAAASMASQAALGALTNATGLPGSIVGAIAKESGLLGAFSGAVSGAVNSATGRTSTGFSAKGLADAIDGAIGSVTSGFGGTGGTGSTGSTEGGGYEPGVLDFTSPFTPTEPLDAPRAQTSAAVAPVSYGLNAADVGPAYDPFQDFIAIPVRDTTQNWDDSLKYLRAAEGGSIEDLAEYLRS